jgi:hypothetical protein
MCIGENTGDSNMHQSLLHLPWPPWVAQEKIEKILTLSHVVVAGLIVLSFANGIKALA